MATKVVPDAAQSDVDIVNTIEPPTLGCPGSLGIQILQPLDWQSQIAASKDVAGCTYARLDAGSLTLDERTQVALGSTAAKSLPKSQADRAAALLVAAQATQVFSAAEAAEKAP